MFSPAVLEEEHVCCWCLWIMELYFKDLSLTFVGSEKNLLHLLSGHLWIFVDISHGNKVSLGRIEAYITADRSYNPTIGLKCNAVDQRGGRRRNQAANRGNTHPTRMSAGQWDSPSSMCKVSSPFPVSMVLGDRSVTVTTGKQCTMA